MTYSKQGLRLINLHNGSGSKEKFDHAIDQAALTISDLISQFNDGEKHHLLEGYFNSSDDLRGLEANLCRAEAQIEKAMQLLHSERLELKMLREAVDYLLSQNGN